MSRRLKILWSADNETPKYHSWTAVLNKGKCTITDELVKSTKPLVKHYTSEYAMIQDIQRDFDVNKGYQVVDCK